MTRLDSIRAGKPGRTFAIVWRLFKEFLVFVRQEKKWWLVPLAAILLAIGALVVFASGSALAPFIYPFL